MKKASVFPAVFGRLFGGGGSDLAAISLRQYREEVLRDLAWLLNTSCHPAKSPVHRHPRVAASTLNFGMRDFTGKETSGLEIEDVADAVRQSIERFEPRIAPSSLVVHVRTAEESHDGASFAVEIIGDLWALPASEPINLRTRWDVVTGAWTFD
jgi:type VI secretion system protein ImpF